MDKDAYDFLRELYYTPLNVYTRMVDKNYSPCAEVVNGVPSLFFFSTTKEGIDFVESTFSEEAQKSLAIGLLPLGDKKFVTSLLNNNIKSRIVFDNKFAVSAEDFIQANIDRINQQEYAQNESLLPVIYICDKEKRKGILTDAYTTKQYTIMHTDSDGELSIQTWMSPEGKETFFFYSSFASALEFVNAQDIPNGEKKNLVIVYMPMCDNQLLSLLQHSFNRYQMFLNSAFFNCKEYLEVNDAVIPDFDTEQKPCQFTVAYDFGHPENKQFCFLFENE